MNKLTYENGWMGGKFLVDGGPFRKIESKPKAKLVIKGAEFQAVYEIRHGSDNDHGHNYPWTVMDIGILDGALVERFLSVREILKKGISVKIFFKS